MADGGVDLAIDTLTTTRFTIPFSTTAPILSAIRSGPFRSRTVARSHSSFSLRRAFIKATVARIAESHPTFGSCERGLPGQDGRVFQRLRCLTPNSESDAIEAPFLQQIGGAGHRGLSSPKRES